MNSERLKTYRDERGDLIPLNFLELPFIPKRIFYVKNVSNEKVRGCHGHYKCKQYYICIKGFITIKLYDGIQEKQITLLPNEGLFVDNMVWTSEMFDSHNDVLLVLCSEEYDANDYFTDKKILNNKS